MKRSITPPDFPEAASAYSHGLEVDVGDSRMIFVTGQIAKDTDGNVVWLNDITAQTEFIFQNIEKILQAANASIDNIVKAVIYVTDIADFKAISAVRNKYFANCRPVSTLIEINRTVKEGCNIEIDVIAIRKK